MSVGRSLYYWLAPLAITAGLVLAGASAPSETFVHISDTHLMDLRAADPQVVKVREPAQPATAALEPLLQQLKSRVRPAFILHSGDIADGYSFLNAAGQPIYQQIELAQRVFAHSPIPVYAVLGNHDISHYAWNGAHTDVAPDQSVAGEARAAWAQQVPCFRNGTYYAWERNVGHRRYLFLMLEDGYHAGTPLDASKESRRFRLSDEQRQWLGTQVQTHPGHVLILTMHVPLGKDEMSQSVKAALAAHPGDVFAFTGHTHNIDAIEDHELGNGRVLHQVRTPGVVVSAKNWRQVKLYEDRVELFKTSSVNELARTIPLTLAAGQSASGR